MNDNILLQCWLELTNPTIRVAKYFTSNNHPIVHIDLIKRLAKHNAITADFGYVDFVELFVNSYVSELLAKNDLQRGNSTSEPHPFWGDNFKYTRHLEPGVLINGDFDNEKDYLRMTLTLPKNDLTEKVMTETHLFMEKARIPRIEAPAHFE